MKTYPNQEYVLPILFNYHGNSSKAQFVMEIYNLKI